VQRDAHGAASCGWRSPASLEQTGRATLGWVFFLALWRPPLWDISEAGDLGFWLAFVLVEYDDESGLVLGAVAPDFGLAPS